MSKNLFPVTVLLLLSACNQPFKPSDETMAQVNAAFHASDMDQAKMACLQRYPLHPAPEAATSGEAWRCIIAIDPSDESARRILSDFSR